MNDAHDRTPTAPGESRQYATPRLVHYGAVHDLTASGSRSGMENFGAMAMINNMG